MFFQHIPCNIVAIHAVGQRIIVCDVQESCHWIRYRRQENQLVIFADDTYPRWVTSAAVMDFATVAVADKFGTIAIVSVEDVITSSNISRCSYDFLVTLMMTYKTIQVELKRCGVEGF